MRRAKIVCTIGPATESPEQLQALVDAGMDVARINRSHGKAEEHEAVIERVRKASATSGRAVAVLVDLQGPKIRLETFQDGPQELKIGDTFTITTRDVPGTKELVGTTFKGLPGDCAPGDRLLIDDGNVAVRVVEVTDTDVVTFLASPSLFPPCPKRTRRTCAGASSRTPTSSPCPSCVPPRTSRTSTRLWTRWARVSP